MPGFGLTGKRILVEEMSMWSQNEVHQDMHQDMHDISSYHITLCCKEMPSELLTAHLTATFWWSCITLLHSAAALHIAQYVIVALTSPTAEARQDPSHFAGYSEYRGNAWGDIWLKRNKSLSSLGTDKAFIKWQGMFITVCAEITGTKLDNLPSTASSFCGDWVMNSSFTPVFKPPTVYVAAFSNNPPSHEICTCKVIWSVLWVWGEWQVSSWPSLRCRVLSPFSAWTLETISCLQNICF